MAAPGRPGFPDPAGATRAGAGRRGGAGAVSGPVAERRAEAGPLELPGAAADEPAEVGGCPPGREADRDRGPESLLSAPGSEAVGAWAGTGVETLGDSERGGLPGGS